MTTDWMPGAEIVQGAHGGGTLVGGPPRCTWHITWDHLDPRPSFDNVRDYLVKMNFEPTLLWDPETGRVAQFVPASRSAYAVRNLAGGVETNRYGDVHVQIEVFFSPGYKGRALFTDGPLVGLDRIMAWLDGLGIPRVAAGDWANPDRDVTRWLTQPGHYGHFEVPENDHCVTADTPVLRADLTWEPAGELIEGDELLAFDEVPEVVGSTTGRRLRPSIVDRNSLFRAPAFRVVTAVGDLLTTADHPWLVRRDHYPQQRVQWVQTRDLEPDRDKVYFASAPWAVDRSHEAGWLAGALDADGHCAADRAHGVHIGFGQLTASPVLPEFVRLMEDRGFVVKSLERPARRWSGKPFTDAQLRGGLWEVLRLLGTVRPVRLTARPGWDGAVVGKTTHRVPIMSVEPAGERWFAALGTSTQTYIANGFLVHNSDPIAGTDIALILATGTAPQPQPPEDPMAKYVLCIHVKDGADPANGKPYEPVEPHPARVWAASVGVDPFHVDRGIDDANNVIVSSGATLDLANPNYLYDIDFGAGTGGLRKVWPLDNAGALKFRLPTAVPE